MRRMPLIAKLAIAPSFLLTACEITALASDAAAQAGPVIATDTRVRLTSPVFGAVGKGRRMTRIIGVSPDTIIFQLEGRTDSLPLRRSEVQRIERWTGRGSQIRRGMKVGTLGGVALGTVMGLTWRASEQCSEPFTYSSEPYTGPLECYTPKTQTGTNVASGAIVFGGLGLLAGAVVGAFARADRWESLPPAAWQSRVTLAPAGSRAVALRVAF